ncbi:MULTISPECIES: hypothetical protein [Haloferacaceae]|uniref:Uncharacterized protein n=1 Tax=Halorubrum glutamatedens TaxID=2707018 RepID=A0ABD5QWU6_9EURY|nr:hypothetical protein [Halobellus captivus]
MPTIVHESETGVVEKEVDEVTYDADNGFWKYEVGEDDTQLRYVPREQVYYVDKDVDEEKRTAGGVTDAY